MRIGYKTVDEVGLAAEGSGAVEGSGRADGLSVPMHNPVPPFVPDGRHEGTRKCDNSLLKMDKPLRIRLK